MAAMSLDQLKASLRGELIQQGDAKYADACKVHNGMIHKRPKYIAYCTDVSDVKAALDFGKGNNLLIAIRGGGHNAGGLGVCDNGLVIDLSRIRYTYVDAAAKTVRVGGGCVWGDVDHATHGFGMATPSGIIGTTGVGGLTLGGGIGHLSRKCGLSIDNLLEAQVVLADGSVVTASEKENRDLFWSIRGGGGNFGIVTSFLFKLHPVDTVYAGPMFWDLEKAPEIMKWYRDFIKTAPDDLNGFFAFLVVPGGPPFPEHLRMRNVCGIVWCFTGGLENGEKTFADIRAKFGAPILDWVGPIPHPALQSMFDGLYAPGLQWYWRADFVKELSDDAIAQHMRFGANIPTMLSTMHLYPVDGKASRVQPGDTAWRNRDAVWAQVIVGVDPDPANADKITRWCKDYFNALHPYAHGGGAYVNFMMDEGQDRIKAAYGDNYARLAAIKTKYDPKNIFRVNQNIQPVAAN
jgi:FAD/FMN-containing dehydrogenase